MKCSGLQASGVMVHHTKCQTEDENNPSRVSNQKAERDKYEGV
jgi:hypothetical protein